MATTGRVPLREGLTRQSSKSCRVGSVGVHACNSFSLVKTRSLVSYQSLSLGAAILQHQIVSRCVMAKRPEMGQQADMSWVVQGSPDAARLARCCSSGGRCSLGWACVRAIADGLLAMSLVSGMIGDLPSASVAGGARSGVISIARRGPAASVIRHDRRSLDMEAVNGDCSRPIASSHRQPEAATSVVPNRMDGHRRITAAAASCSTGARLRPMLRISCPLAPAAALISRRRAISSQRDRAPPAPPLPPPPPSHSDQRWHFASCRGVGGPRACREAEKR